LVTLFARILVVVVSELLAPLLRSAIIELLALSLLRSAIT
jgi:hypothetical protein